VALPAIIQVGGAEQLTVLGAELKDLAHFDPAGLFEGGAAAGAWFTGLNQPDVGHHIHSKVPVRVDVYQMGIFLVGPANGVAHAENLGVGDDPHSF